MRADIDRSTDRQTNRHTNYNTLQPYLGITSLDNEHIISHMCRIWRGQSLEGGDGVIQLMGGMCEIMCFKKPF